MKNTIQITLWTFASLLMLNSCGSVFEEGEERPTPQPELTPGSCKLRFDDSYNMTHTNDFAEEVISVRLFILDSETKYILYDLEEKNLSKLADDDYAMQLPSTLFEYDVDGNPVTRHGKIDLLAWCGVGAYDEVSMPSYDLTNDIIASGQKNRIEDLGVSLYGNLSDRISKPLDVLHHGVLMEQTLVAGKENVLTMPLVRNTNHIRVELLRQDGGEIDPMDFDFTLTAHNSQMAWDNTLTSTKAVAYGAYEKRIEYTAEGMPMAVSDFSTGRMVEDEIMHLQIKHDDTPMLSIPIIEHVLQVKGQYDINMNDQEFLDRMNEWTFTFMLDDQGQWDQGTFQINGWLVLPRN